MSAGDDKYRPAIASSEPSRCDGAVRSWEVTDGSGNLVEVADYTRDDSAFEVYGASSKGPDRQNDEDFIITTRIHFPNKGLDESVYILCDGMGGYGAGDEASRLVGVGIADYYMRFRYHGNNGSSLDAEGALRLAAQATDTDLKQNVELARVRAGSTAVVCVVDEKTGEYTILNIGDSSASLVDSTHNIRITSRHGDDRGRLLHGFSSSADRKILSEDELRYYYENGQLRDPQSCLIQNEPERRFGF